MLQQCGLDQGCPLSPGLYALAVRDALAEAQEAMRAFDSAGRVVAYLDDTYLVGAPAAMAPCLAVLRAGLAQRGLALRAEKTQAWAPDAALELPPELAACRRPELKAVGSVLNYATPASADDDEDWRDVPVDVALAPTGDQSFLGRQKAYFERLLLLHKHGLAKARVWQLLQAWTNGACVHLMRALPTSVAWAEEVDMAVCEMAECLVGEVFRADQRGQLFLRDTEGGVGLGSARLRQDAAFLAAWEAGVGAVADALGAASVAELERAWPAWAAAIRGAEARVAENAGKRPPPARWQSLVEGRPGKAQREYAEEVRKRTLASVRGTSVADQAGLEAASGRAAGAWLFPRVGAEPMADEHWEKAMRLRLRCNRVVAGGGSDHCLNASASQGVCGRPADPAGQHALKCPRGGGTVRRHNAIREALLGWLRERGVAAEREQEVPRWHRADERAVLDVVYQEGPRAWSRWTSR